MIRFVLLLALLPGASGGLAAAQDLWVYDNGLAGGFEDWGWASRDFAYAGQFHSAPVALRWQTDKVDELAGRTQLLLIARERLYRACELSLNYNASQETAWNMYATVVELVAALGKTEMTRSDAELIRSQAALDNAKAALEKVREQENK